MVRSCIILFVLIPTLTGCGLAQRFLSTNECEGETCEAPVLLDNSNVEKKWFCYGSEQGEEWQCQNEKDPSKIKAVAPKPPRPSQVVQVAPVATPAPLPPTQRVPNASDVSAKILDLPRNHYAVQLIALRNLAGVKEYASLNGIQEPQLVKIQNDDSDWYVLLLGTYAERSDAETAKDNWETAKVLRVQPWIRQLGPLQDAILAAQD